MVGDEVKYLEALRRRRTTLPDHRTTLVDAPFILLDCPLEQGCGSLGIAGVDANFHNEFDERRQRAEQVELLTRVK